MKLSELAGQLPAGSRLSEVTEDPEITAIEYRSQDVAPGGLFVAVAGQHADGHNFITQAVANGAAAIVAEAAVDVSPPVVCVTDSRRALADLSAIFYGRPSSAIPLIGITGTNGKTTVSYILEHILQASGARPGVIGTLGYRFDNRTHPLPMTTPESRDLQRILAAMRDAGVTHVVLEVSSHALAQDRVRGCDFAAGVFTNLSRDHLDYHGDLETYWACKKRLFTDHMAPAGSSGGGVAVINCTDPRGLALAAELAAGGAPAVITVGRTSDSRIHPTRAACSRAGVLAEVATETGPIQVTSALVGEYNLDNLLCAIGAAQAVGIENSAIANGIQSLDAVAGRLEPVPNAQDRFVFVDYAHTPDALDNVLNALREISDQRIICVFGCGGDRDRGKRPLMGAIAGRQADLSIVTSDNPRTESTAAIIDQIEAGIRPLGLEKYTSWDLEKGFSSPGFAIVPNRMQAIRLAFAASTSGDSILIAGKGHETYQVIGTQTIDFDDRRAAAVAMAEPASAESPDPALPLPWMPDHVLEAVGGDAVCMPPGRRMFSGISTDSRNVRPGDWFAALAGEQHDGHDYIEAVVAKGVRGLLINRSRIRQVTDLLASRPDVHCIAVEDTLMGLGRLAAYHRVRTGIPVVALTGSNGKTTTRVMIASVVSRHFRTLATEGNLNNEVGLPLTLLKAAPRHQWAVLEMGMNHPGEIDRLAAICAPRIGLITNIGPAHLEFLGSLEGVMHAKGEMLDHMAADAVAILNGDDPYCMKLSERSPCPVVRFGLTGEAEIRATGLRPLPEATVFTLALPETSMEIRLGALGRFMVANAVAAAAVGWQLGIAPETIRAGLEAFVPVDGRMRPTDIGGGIQLLDDAYNANPGSMRAAIDTLSEMAGRQPSHLVVGDMLELGPTARSLHADMGAHAARAGIGYLYAAGNHADAVAGGAADSGMAADRIVIGNQDELLQALLKTLRPGAWVLVKGSRGMRMENVVAGLTRALSREIDPNGEERS